MPLPFPENESALKQSDEILKDLKQLSTDLDRLKNSYEQYFLGLERKEPIRLRESVLALIRKLSGIYMKSAGLKFQHQQLVARFNTLTPYWDRILKEIEEGRYQRDVFKAQMHERERLEAGKRIDARTELRKQTDEIKTIFDAYVAERKKNKETGQVSFDKFKTQLQAQMDQLKAKSANVSLKVVSENGKAKLKAVAQTKKTK